MLDVVAQDPRDDRAPTAAPGERPGLHEVYDRHAEFVMRCARHLRVRPEHVEDVVHDVFLVVHARLPDFDPERATLRSWLYGILRRVALHHHRADRRARRRLTLVPPPPLAPSLDEQLARTQAADLVTAFVEHLDDKKRPVFALAEIEGVPAPEIARCLDVPLNTVYSRLRLARRELERFLQGGGRLRGSDQ
jgi:RNA polymerase sigma-70 factor (ECF subfamily)